MTKSPRLTFFLDVDNTLLDNDGAKAEMDRQLSALLGTDGAADFWRVYEEIRGEETVVDIPSTIARFCARERKLEQRFALADIFMSFDFHSFVFPSAFPVLKQLQSFGTTAILSDGDPVFQTAKIHRSGLADSVGGNVAVFPHKEQHLPEIMAAYPADHFIFIDDKPTVLDKIAAGMCVPCSTVFIRQGKYARSVPKSFSPSHSLASLADLLTIDVWPTPSRERR